MSTMINAYTEHQRWLSELYTAHASILGGAADSAAPTHAASYPPPSASPAPSLPSAPMAWARPEESNVAYAFAGMSLDFQEFDEGPVYRSLGGLFSDCGSERFEDEEEPVYRSLDIGAATQSAEVHTDTDREAQWLQTMPPLIKRQRAGNLLA